MLGLALVLLAFAAMLATTPRAIEWAGLYGFGNGDLTRGYLVGAQRFLETGSPYAPATVQGPWYLGPWSFIHPPTALVLFVPFLWLPLWLWWAVPLAVTALCLYRLHPAPWTWPLMALALVWPRSVTSIVAGNTDMWAMAFVAAGAVWGWPAALLAIKPTFAPLAVVSVRRRGFWLAALVGALLSLPTLPLWLDYARVIGNVGLGPTYSLYNLPLIAIPFVGWLGGKQSGVAEIHDQPTYDPDQGLRRLRRLGGRR